MSAVQITLYAAKIRGGIIDYSIKIERVMDYYIAHRFCKGDAGLTIGMMELMLSTNRIIFDEKRQIMEFLVDEYDPDYKKRNPTLFNDLERRIIPKRNFFAHQMLLSDEEAQQNFKERIGFLVFKGNKRKKIWVAKKEISELLNLLGKTYLALVKENQLLRDSLKKDNP